MAVSTAHVRAALAKAEAASVTTPTVPQPGPCYWMVPARAFLEALRDGRSWANPTRLAFVVAVAAFDVAMKVAGCEGGA
jgi:hypothetical protein